MNAMQRRGATIGPIHLQMRVQFGIAIAVLLCARVVGAQPSRWEIVADPPSPRLPHVRVVLGEPGYVSTVNTPIEIHATASAAFDGYIGVHFEVGGRKTIDVPVVARAHIAQGGQWSFRTWIQLEGGAWRQLALNRELAVEWRDTSMRVIGSTVAGTPPWSHPRPLRVMSDSGETPGECCLGVDPHVRSRAELSDVAQWYSGFRELIVDTSLWLDLPAAVKAAAFSSGVPIVFVGPPLPDQSMSELDRVLLPVELTPSPGEYQVPWPWGAGATPRGVPLAWRSKPGTAVAGGGAMPYLASNGRAVFVADTLALALPLPAMRTRSSARHSNGKLTIKTSPLSIVRESLSLLAGIAVLLLCAVLALILRRSPRMAALAVSLLVTAGLIACRDQLRPRVGVSILDESVPVAPGVVRHVVDVREHGPTPIPARDPSVPDPHLWVSRRGRVRQEAELRTSNTLPGQGAMYLDPNQGPWDSTARSMSRDEVGHAVEVKIRQKSGEKLVVEYVAPFAPHFARALWHSNGVRHVGDVRLDNQRRGEVSISPFHLFRELQSIPMSFRTEGDVQMWFVRIERDATTVAGWSSPADESTEGAAHDTFGTLSLQPDGTLRQYFAVPSSEPSLTISIRTANTLRRVMAAGPRETVELEPASGGRNLFHLDRDILQRIAERGIVQLIVEPVEPAETYQAWMSWKESR